MIRFACPGCGATYRASDDRAGRTAHCKRCGMALIIPPAEPPAEFYHAPGPDGGDDYLPPRRRSNPAAGCVALLTVGMLAASAVLLVWGFSRAPASKPAPAPAWEDDFAARPEVGITLGLLAVFALVLVGFLVLHILVTAWIVRDARNRSVEGGVMWAIASLFFGLIVLLIYLASRPHGALVPCRHCGNRRLGYVRACPHCRRR